jgi:hypothetical protein
MKVSNIKCKIKHQISIMGICGSYMFEFSISKDMKKNIIKEVGVRKVATHLGLTLNRQIIYK